MRPLLKETAMLEKIKNVVHDEVRMYEIKQIAIATAIVAAACGAAVVSHKIKEAHKSAN
jgi:hypothetical protein